MQPHEGPHPPPHEPAQPQVSADTQSFINQVPPQQGGFINQETFSYQGGFIDQDAFIPKEGDFLS